MINTTWGYSVNDEELPSLLSSDDFSVMSNGLYSKDDKRVEMYLNQASAAIRSYCGWHIAPVLECNAPISVQGNQRLFMLPCLFVSKVKEIYEDGNLLPKDSYDWSYNGCIRRCGWKCWSNSMRGNYAIYDAGFEINQVPDLATVVYQVVANAVAAAPGVRSESVGDVSTSFNQTASGVSGGITLLDRDLRLLEPYCLRARM